MDGTNRYPPWPKPVFYFKVTFGDKGDLAFQEVTGLTSENDVIEYHEVEHPIFPAPHLNAAPELMFVRLKKGICQNRNLLTHLLNSVSSAAEKPETVTIQLLDDADKPRFTWTLKNARVVLFPAADFDIITDEVEIDELELRHEGLTRKK